jgi:uncharacterized protein (TIGR03435 family)
MSLAAAHAQAPATSDLKFEVATLKASEPGGRGGGIRPTPGGERYEATNCTLKTMMMVAYRVKPDQITGGPGWVETDRFDMKAKPEHPSNGEELHAMLRNLFADRFELKIHHEKKELPVYALTVDKSGPKLKVHAEGNAGDVWIDQSVEGIVQVKMKGVFCPMEYLAFRLAQLMDRPVIDLTGLKGNYDFDLAYTRELPPGIPERASLNGVAIDTSGATVFTALKQQLGLDLKAQKGPVDIIVIDHVAKPADN